MALWVYHKYFAAAVAVLTACILAALLSLAVSSSVHFSLQQSAQEYLRRVDDIATETQHTLDQLNAMPAQRCSAADLAAMRQLLLGTRYIRDITYYNGNDAICSASAGKLSQYPVSEDPSFYSVRNSSIWLHQPLGDISQRITGTVVRQHHYSVSIVSDIDTLPPRQDVRWQLVNIAGIAVAHTSGNRGIYQSAKPETFAALQWPYYYYHQCSAYSRFCLAQQFSFILLLRNYPLQSTVVMLALLALSVLAWFGWRQLAVRRHSLRYRVSKGLKHGHFSVVFQPIIDLEQNQVTGCEVLARYQDPLGQLSPLQFIPMLSKLGLSSQFTCFIAQQALSGLSTVPGLSEQFYLSLNVYPQDIASGRILQLLQLPEVQQRKIKLVLEITEQQELSFNSSKLHLASLKAAGLLLSIDDFGTGYSNLAGLRSLNADYLKIDKSFIQDMEADSIKSTLIPKIRDIARLLNYRIVAEGIENLAQASLLRSLGIELGQGWHFARAMPLTEFADYLRQFSCRQRRSS
ncbi:EAL domain-containing protein [Rheinheimera aquimaris]|uniref:EAL domain-containing protein n=1 Tax=Rheinheimera aquimaris TaxID=412437 RepID=UPI001CFFA7BF|nr:EAL domain-containing protein [Rheinheimera aquimaris]MCB5215494.1 EAL domain-containing protein [Rheinheimera aquimaris]